MWIEALIPSRVTGTVTIANNVMERLVDRRWRQTVFSAAAHEYSWLDVFLAAMFRDEWPSFERRLIEGLACLAEVESEDSWPDASRVDNLATTFRYDRELLTTEETITWIERVGLTLDDWTDFLVRRLLRDDWSDRLDVLVTRHGAGLRVSDNAFAAEGICSGFFHHLARTLARRAAVSAPLTAGTREAVEVDRVSCTRRDHSAWLDALDPADVTRRLVHLAELESIFEAHTRARTTTEALASQLARNRLEWTRVELERLSFDTADAAREAACCVREDGLTLS